MYNPFSFLKKKPRPKMFLVKTEIDGQTHYLHPHGYREYKLHPSQTGAALWREEDVQSILDTANASEWGRDAMKLQFEKIELKNAKLLGVDDPTPPSKNNIN